MAPVERELLDAIDHALAGASLRAGGSPGTTAIVVDDHEPAAVESGDADGD